MTTTMVSTEIDSQQDNMLFPNHPHWQACFEHFLSDLYAHSGSISTYVNYRSIMFQMFSRDPERDPGSVSQHDVRLFLDRVSTSKRNKGLPLSASTKNTNISCLTSFYRLASAWQTSPGVFLYTGALPTQGLKPFRRTRESRFIPLDDLAKLFATCDRTTEKGQRDFCILTFYLLTCRRRQEVQRLTWGSLEQSVVREKDGTLRNAILYRYVGKGNQRRERVHELPAECYRLLCTYLEFSGRLADMQPESPLFVGVFEGQWRKDVGGSVKDAPLTATAIGAMFKERCALAQISTRYSVHWLRHSGAKLRWESGGDLFSVQDTLDHENIATTHFYLTGMTGTGDSLSQKVVERLPFLASAGKS